MENDHKSRSSTPPSRERWLALASGLAALVVVWQIGVVLYAAGIAVAARRYGFR